MINDNLTNEQLTNLDKLNSFYNNKISVHIKLLRTNPQGQNIFLNGLLIEKDSETLFVLKERVLGEIRISLYEIKSDGVTEERK
jgi:hypothetical protein